MDIKSMKFMIGIGNIYVLDTLDISGGGAGAALNLYNPKSPSQKWTIVPYPIHGILTFALVNDNGWILNRSGNNVPIGYYDGTVSESNLWIMESNDYHAVFNGCDYNGNENGLVLTPVELGALKAVSTKEWSNQNIQKWDIYLAT